MTDGVVETPHGAHFTECVPDYPRDEAFQREYAATAKSDEAWDAFQAKYIDVTEAEYQAAVADEQPSVTDVRSGPPTRAEVCAVALAGVLPRRRRDPRQPDRHAARRSAAGSPRPRSSPTLVMTDGEALLVENILPVGVDAPEKVVSGWNPYRTMFDVVWSGRRHIIMGGSQLDHVRQPELRVHRPAREADHAAARHARRARQHDPQQDLVLDLEPLARA